MTGSHAQSENPQGGYQIDANGQQFTANGFLLDGTENNSSILGIAVINPNIDSLQEFKVTTSDYDAQFGSVAGALMQATTKSGTNQHHGSALRISAQRLLQRQRLDVSGINSCRCAGTSSAASFGGPIVKDKLFFSAIIRARADAGPRPTTTTVPSRPSEAGDLTALLGDYIVHRQHQPRHAMRKSDHSDYNIRRCRSGAAPEWSSIRRSRRTRTALAGTPSRVMPSLRSGRVNVLPSVPGPVTKTSELHPHAQQDDTIFQTTTSRLEARVQQ